MHYLVQVNLYLLAFFSFYLFLFRKEKFFQLNRFYLMGGTLLSFVIPLLSPLWITDMEITHELSSVMIEYDPVFMVKPLPTVSPVSFSPKELLLIAYIVGFLYYLYVLAKKILKTHKAMNEFDIGEDQAYSFFGKVVIGKSLKKYHSIYDHEWLHVSQMHSFDILFFEMIAVICWFNPVVYGLKNEVKLLHEFQADDYASRKLGNTPYYAALLLSKQFESTPEVLLSHGFFNESSLKSRLKMLLKNDSKKTALLKYGFVAPVFLIMMILSSASLGKSLAQSNLYAALEKDLIAPHVVKQITVDLTEVYIVGKRVEEGLTMDITRADPKEKMPEFVGGESELMKYLSKHVRYTPEARKNRVEGRILVQFTVMEDGSLKDIEVIKGLGYGLDEVAVKLVENMPNWSPALKNGRPFATGFVIPVVFSL